MSDLKFPMVECDAHPGEREPGYIVCHHVLAGTPVAHLERATAETLGVVACEECHAHGQESDYVQKNFVLSCAQGMREKGFLASA